jgi:hypothetical protein
MWKISKFFIRQCRGYRFTRSEIFCTKYTGKQRKSQLGIAIRGFFCILASTQQKGGGARFVRVKRTHSCQYGASILRTRSRVAATAVQGLQTMATNTGETADSIVTVEEDLTPEHLRCASGLCPAVHRASDGDLVIIGKIPSQTILNQMSKKVGQDEFIVKISPEFFRSISLDD